MIETIIICWTVFGAIMGVITTKKTQGYVTVGSLSPSLVVGAIAGLFMIYIYYEETQPSIKKFWDKKLF